MYGSRKGTGVKAGSEAEPLHHFEMMDELPDDSDFDNNRQTSKIMSHINEEVRAIKTAKPNRVGPETRTGVSPSETPMMSAKHHG